MVKTKIHLLSEGTINRIAAGEVIERPFSVVKELVENAIDAGATHIEIALIAGGKEFISVTDNGYGMVVEDMVMAMERHATSKLSEKDDGDGIFQVNTLGFRGEALPSIGSVSRMMIVSRADDTEHAMQLKIEGGVVDIPSPAAGQQGTRVEVRDLFFMTPARLKFLKSDRAEVMAISDVVKRLAMSRPMVGFTLSSEGKRNFHVQAEKASECEVAKLNRLSAVMGREFGDNSVSVSASREGVHLTGFAGLPTYNKAMARQQYLFVNHRPVKDRLLNGAIRAAYQDFLARDRHPVVALFIDMEGGQVDMNVHPAKTEVRFRDAASIRSMVIGALRAALAEAGHRASTTVADTTLQSFTGGGGSGVSHNMRQSADRLQSGFAHFDGHVAPPPVPVGNDVTEEREKNYPLGLARAQLHETYIVSQTSDGLVIVDQHAAHERLVYERMKKEIEHNGIARQVLLMPEVVDLEDDICHQLMERSEELANMGFVIEHFGQGAILVREIPALIGDTNVTKLVQDLADEIIEWGVAFSLKERLEEISSTLACHTAIRAGRRLGGEEMNALLREMESTPYAGQCNHGRPTYVELKLIEIEKLFGRR